ncbi:MAG: type II 3-dehydroquinate dehydratase [Bacteroidetes bacterium]|nr:type II 3-dehydroquinate dehydratase [Bacteroidota bacterium]
MKIAIINGPNLNLLGKREPEIYGDKGFDSFLKELESLYPKLELVYFQSNVEGELINKLHEFGFTFDGIILNAGAYTHTSLALADAVAAIKTPVIEVHISNIFAREDFRHVSYLGAKCLGSISGLGLKGYKLALNYFIKG